MADDYIITGQDQGTDIGPDRRFRDVLKVTYETLPDHVAGSVDVPLNLATPEYVAQLVQQRADLHKGIAAL